MLGVLRRLLTVSSGLVLFFLLFPLNSLYAKSPLKESTTNSTPATVSAPKCAVPLTFDDVKNAFIGEAKNHVSVHWEYIFSRGYSNNETCKNSKLLIALRGQFSELLDAFESFGSTIILGKFVITVPPSCCSGSVKFDKKSRILTIELNPEADVWENGNLIDVYYIPISAEDIVKVLSANF